MPVGLDTFSEALRAGAEIFARAAQGAARPGRRHRPGRRGRLRAVPAVQPGGHRDRAQGGREGGLQARRADRHRARPGHHGARHRRAGQQRRADLRPGQGRAQAQDRPDDRLLGRLGGALPDRVPGGRPGRGRLGRLEGAHRAHRHDRAAGRRRPVRDQPRARPPRPRGGLRERGAHQAQPDRHAHRDARHRRASRAATAGRRSSATAPARPRTRRSRTSRSPRTAARSRPAPRPGRSGSPSTTGSCASRRSWAARPCTRVARRWRSAGDGRSGIGGPGGGSSAAGARPGRLAPRFVDKGAIFAGYVGIGMAIVIAIAFALIIPVQTLVFIAAIAGGVLIGAYANQRSNRWRPMKRVFGNALWAALITGLSPGAHLGHPAPRLRPVRQRRHARRHLPVLPAGPRLHLAALPRRRQGRGARRGRRDRRCLVRRLLLQQRRAHRRRLHHRRHAGRCARGGRVPLDRQAARRRPRRRARSSPGVARADHGRRAIGSCGNRPVVAARGGWCWRPRSRVTVVARRWRRALGAWSPGRRCPDGVRALTVDSAVLGRAHAAPGVGAARHP